MSADLPRRLLTRRVHVRPGSYKLTETLNVPPRTVIIGTGRTAAQTTLVLDSDSAQRSMFRREEQAP